MLKMYCDDGVCYEVIREEERGPTAHDIWMICWDGTKEFEVPFLTYLTHKPDTEQFYDQFDIMRSYPNWQRKLA